MSGTYARIAFSRFSFDISLVPERGDFCGKSI